MASTVSGKGIDHYKWHRLLSEKASTVKNGIACLRKGKSTATATTTPSKKCVSILLWNFSFVEYYSVCLSVLKLAPAEYATNAFSSK